MKIAVSSQGKTLNDAVDQRFGRAAGFVIVDTEDGSVTPIDNVQNLNAVQGAGIQAAKTVVDSGAEVVLTGHCGPKAFRALSAAQIKVCTGADGTVGEAVEKYKRGEFEVAGDADVEGHW
jgi:predicted Fe-Mo cluster-binding NifX family protein